MKYLERLKLKGHKKGIGLKYALSGLFIVLREERNLRIHLVIACFVILTGIFVNLNQIEWIVIMLTIHFVILMELINSIIERLIDYIKPDIHPTAKKIKDISAAIVLIAAMMSVIIGLFIFLPKLFSLLI